MRDDDVVAEALPQAARSTLRRRRQRFRPGEPDDVGLLPDAWRELLRDFARRAPRTRWTTILADAGGARVEAAHALCDWLLRAGWITVTESFERGRWQPQWIEFRDAAALRAALGLADPDAAARAWQDAVSHAFEDPRVNALRVSLTTTPPAFALRRHALLVALDLWIAEARFGTRRDFALHARGDTKAITDAEWAWLAAGLDLETVGITRHAMTIEVRAPLALVTPGGRIDLRASVDFMSLTAPTVDATLSLEGEIATWRVVENRTSFERVARECGDRDAVVWVPGYPPPAWRDAVSTLVRLKRAPAAIACDPDPDGIRIALAVGAIWSSHRCDWSPWRMDARTLAAASSRRDLSARDRQHLDALLAANLPTELQELARWMHEHEVKGEQEAYL